MWFIEDLERLGVTVKKHGQLFGGETSIPSGSPQYQSLLDMLGNLGDTRIDVYLNWTGSNKPYNVVDSRTTFYSYELRDQMDGLNPEHPHRIPGAARGEASWLVEAAVKMVEDPPECCEKARMIPDGHYMISVEVEFMNLTFAVSVFRKSKSLCVARELTHPTSV